MKWPWSKDREDGSAKNSAVSAAKSADHAKNVAEKRWYEVDRVTDEFASAVEKAMRRTR